MESREYNIRREIQSSKKGISRKKALVVSAIILAAIASYFYFGIISPVVTKPVVEKPGLAGGVKAENVNYVLNELGAYKLHDSIAGERPEVEVVVAGTKFSVTVQEGKLVTAEANAVNPDVRITASPDAIARLFAAADMKLEIQKLYDEGAITVELLKDEAALALKGYKGIYDELYG